MQPLLSRLPAALLALGLATAAAAAPVTVKVIGFNDFHGQLESPGSYRATPTAPYVPAGGVDALAGYVAAARAANPRTAVVSVGDLIGASPIVSALFHDEPTIEAMNRLGLDFNTVGNHEFDDGKTDLRRMQRGGCHPTDAGRTCLGAQVGTPVPFEGARFGFLAANVVRAANGSTFFPPYGIKTFRSDDGQPVRVAFIGVTLKETPQLVAPAGIRGLRFMDEALAINTVAPQLKAAGVHAVVALVHQGGLQSVFPNDINGCEGGLEGSPLKAIVGQLGDAVDVVLSGHTHAAYNCRLPLASGKPVPVVSAASTGRVLSEIDLTIEPRQRRVQAVSVVNKVVDRSNPAITLDAGLATLVANYKAVSAPIANQVVGRIARDVPNTKDAACTMPAGEWIADAQLAATTASGGAQLALMNPGGVRSPGFVYAGSAAGEGDGNVTYGESFTVQPFGNSLVTLTLTSQQLKDALEQQFPNCLGQTTYSRVLLPSAGVHYEWDMAQACGAKVRSLSVALGGVPVPVVDAAGRVLEPARTWRVTVNSFLADGGDAFSVFKAGGNRVGGGQDIDALNAHMAPTLSGAPYDPLAPGLGKPRIVRVDGGTACP